MTRIADTRSETDVSGEGALAPEGARQDGDASFAAFLMSDPLPSRSAENFQKLLSGARRLTIHLVEAKEALRASQQYLAAWVHEYSKIPHSERAAEANRAQLRLVTTQFEKNAALLAKLEGK